jgi:hypothetical protein
VAWGGDAAAAAVLGGLEKSCILQLHLLHHGDDKEDIIS